MMNDERRKGFRVWGNDLCLCLCCIGALCHPQGPKTSFKWMTTATSGVLARFTAAGADEIIVIANPINERSVREIGALLPELRNAVR